MTPNWKSKPGPAENLWGAAGEGTLEGSEFTIGVARGSMRGGDWSVSFVRKRVEDVTFVDVSECEPAPCDPVVETNRLRNVEVSGVEFAWSPTFVTFAQRLQIGATIGGGVGKPKGDAEQTLIFPPIPGLPGSGFQDTIPIGVDEFFYKVIPLVRAEVHVNVIAAPGFKIRLGGGFNSPGTAAFRVGAVVLAGAR